MVIQKIESIYYRHTRRLSLLIFLSALSTFPGMTASAQVLDKVQPMGEWAEHINVKFDGKPLLVHLRTGYQREVEFPEPVALHSINNTAIFDGETAGLPNCEIDISNNVMAFSPLQRFKQQRVSVRGTNTGTIYDLVVSSSATGKRQPIRMFK